MTLNLTYVKYQIYTYADSLHNNRENGVVQDGHTLYNGDVTPAILLRDFVALLNRATKLQHANVHVTHCDFVA